MNKIKITVKKIVNHIDLQKQYENPILHTCDMKEGMEFISIDCKKPIGFCDSAWESIYPFVSKLSNNIYNLYYGWMKNPKTAMISCNDGFRPVSFYLEVID